ncbi:MAG TPA: hypothetical protein EYP58_06005 [bacterium (Candidatus Stahlbacteria)]|nr:hypothetical protein [Candidatus Stahlbacteria bacterium]
MRYICIILLLTPVIVSAGHVLVWNFDPLDRFYDSEVGGSVDCSYWLKQTLTANGHTYQVWNDTLLPTNLDPYDVILGALGWYRC